MKEKTFGVQRLTAIAMLAALSYVVFTYGQIKISLSGGDATSIHLGNAVCVLGALLLGGFAGGLGGAIGMTIGDLLDPIYIVYAPKTFLLKFCIGFITGLIAHKIGRINESSDDRHVWLFASLAAACGLLFNVIFDPLLGYFYKLLILGRPAAEVALTWKYPVHQHQRGYLLRSICGGIYGHQEGAAPKRYVSPDCRVNR